jgi:hypothetical protein
MQADEISPKPPFNKRGVLKPVIFLRWLSPVLKLMEWLQHLTKTRATTVQHLISEVLLFA